jgi:hypothetical protein
MFIVTWKDFVCLGVDEKKRTDNLFVQDVIVTEKMDIVL